jgi:NAD dependent epimerase/dehydratase family
MKVVVVGGTGLIGSKVVSQLDQHGHEAIAASPENGVNTLTGVGLADVLTGAQVVVDVSNSPSLEDGPAWDFFTTATGKPVTSVWWSMTTRWFPPPPRRCSPPASRTGSSTTLPLRFGSTPAQRN